MKTEEMDIKQAVAGSNAYSIISTIFDEAASLTSRLIGARIESVYFSFLQTAAYRMFRIDPDITITLLKILQDRVSGELDDVEGPAAEFEALKVFAANLEKQDTAGSA